jgi:hypothetical protein
MAKTKTVTIRKNGKTRKLHGAAAAAVLRARAKRERKKNGVGSVVKRAVHAAASAVEKKTRKRGARKRANQEQRDGQHPIEVTRHYRKGPAGYMTPRQRASAAGQKWLFENPAHLHMRTRKRRNSEAGAPVGIETLYQDFQGRDIGGYTFEEAPPWTPDNVAVLGELNKLHLGSGERIPFDPEQVQLCADKNGELLIVGAQFAITGELPDDDSNNFDVIEVPPYMPDEVIVIDEIKKIEYITHKDHIGDGGEYNFVHKFGEEGGARPLLALDAQGFPMIVGGDYFITAEGIRD